VDLDPGGSAGGKAMNIITKLKEKGQESAGRGEEAPHRKAENRRGEEARAAAGGAGKFAGVMLTYFIHPSKSLPLGHNEMQLFT
jgi:hypothetical protein